MKRYFISLAALAIIIGVIIAWSHYTRYIEFNRYHRIIAEHSTHTVSGNITGQIKQQERLMAVFIKHHQDIVQELVNHPYNETHIALLTDEISHYFPSYFTFTITDADGTPILEDIESLVGPVCIQDLKAYMASGTHLQRIHPSSYAYHYDVVAPFRVHGRDYLFFVSFHAGLLGDIIKVSQAPSHRLYLAMATDDGNLLLEALATGARNTEIRDTYILGQEELGRTLSNSAIEDTRWLVIDSYNEGLYDGFIRGLFKDSAVYLGSLILVMSILSIYLTRAERRKVKAEKHKDEFLSIVSHELRTPLTAINGSLSLLSNLRDSGEDKKQNLLNIAISNTSKLTLLVNDILDLQKMEAGKMEYHMTPIDLHQLIHDSIKDIEPFAEETGAGIKSSLMDERVFVSGDQARLLQVMFNLISNAIKYGKQNDTVIVSTSLLNTHHVRVAVTDHGPGIDDDFKERLFEKFTQADSTPSRRFNGTGLGLSIVKLIIEEHHGSVGFFSGEGEGSTFYFDLPLEDGST